MSKLYCIATSEKASKGQGGNNFLKIDILCGDKRKNVANIEVILWENEIENVYTMNINGEKYEPVYYVEKKGKSQKNKRDENWYCGKCGSKKEEYEAYYCDTCYKELPHL